MEESIEKGHVTASLIMVDKLLYQYTWCLFSGFLRMLKNWREFRVIWMNKKKKGKYALKWETPGASSISLMKKRLKDNLLVYKCLLSKGMKIDNWWLFNLADKGLTRFNGLKFKLDKLRFRTRCTSYFFFTGKTSD